MTRGLVAALASLGFQALGRSAFACRAANLVHGVILTRGRDAETAVSPVVWHPCFLDDGESFSAETLQSPVSGNVGRGGVDSSTTWTASELDVDFIVDVLVRFLGNYAEFGDIQRSLQDRFVTPYFGQRIVAFQDFVWPDPPIDAMAAYPVEGGALSKIESDERSRHFLQELLAPLDFTLVDGEDIVAIRPRGLLYDCVRILPDVFGTFATLICFPWTKEVWKADSRWKGIYYPMVRRDVRTESGSWLEEVRSLGPASLIAVRGGVEAELRELERTFATVGDFVDNLGSQWMTIGSVLRGRLNVPGTGS